jgi:hypothetical protein
MKKANYNFPFDTLEHYMKRAGITTGYTEKPCLNPKDKQCPDSAPNKKSQLVSQTVNLHFFWQTSNYFLLSSATGYWCGTHRRLLRICRLVHALAGGADCRRRRSQSDPSLEEGQGSADGHPVDGRT